MEQIITINDIKSAFSLEEIESHLKTLRNLNLLVIGDVIIDTYSFVVPKGRAIKDPILSTGFKFEEKYAGGVLAIGNHLSSYVNKVKILSLIGDRDSELEFIKKSLAGNVELKEFIKENSPTNIKKRYIDHYRKNKLFKVEYMNDKPISEELTKEIVDYLDSELINYDIVIVGDFGHGFINTAIRDILEKKAKYLSINVQSNSANMGYNYINHYKNPNFIVLNEAELRLPLMRRFEEIHDVIEEFYRVFKYEKFLVTVGKKGCIFFNNKKLYTTEASKGKVIDTVGAGDAVFAITTLFTYLGADNQLVPFISNCAGAIKSGYMGNKESVTKEKLLNFIRRLYENEVE